MRELVRFSDSIDAQREPGRFPPGGSHLKWEPPSRVSWRFSPEAVLSGWVRTAQRWNVLLFFGGNIYFFNLAFCNFDYATNWRLLKLAFCPWIIMFPSFIESPYIITSLLLYLYFNIHNIRTFERVNYLILCIIKAIQKI